MRRCLRKCLTCYLALAMLAIGVTPRVYAGFSPSEGIALSPAERAGDLQKLQKFLEMKVVGERLKDYSFTPEEIQSRLGQLSDSQLHELAVRVDDLQVGGDGFGVIVALLAIALLVFILVLLLQHRIVIK